MTSNIHGDFALKISSGPTADGTQNIWGMVMKKNQAGEQEYIEIHGGSIGTVYDERYFQKSMKIIAKTKERDYEVTGQSLSLIPLINRRVSPEGEILNTRITEAMTEYQCDGLTGFGMSEYLDQIIDGEPVGKAC